MYWNNRSLTSMIDSESGISELDDGTNGYEIRRENARRLGLTLAGTQQTTATQDPAKFQFHALTLLTNRFTNNSDENFKPPTLSPSCLTVIVSAPTLELITL